VRVGMPSETKVLEGCVAPIPVAADPVQRACVTNMPRVVPQTSSVTTSAAILPYVQRLTASNEWRQFQPLRRGINVDGGELVHPALKGMI